MKSSVFDRPMFSKKPNAGVDVDNVGIMQGFKDQSEEDPEDVQEHQSDEDMEKMHMADRRPDAPEILMNNLRGNMQSVDARYEELAKLVGKSVARDTPEEILALLQPVLAEAQQGIGGLPGAQGMPGMPPPPSGMPTPPPPGPNAGLPPPTPPSGGAAPSMPAAQGQGAPGSFPPAPDAGSVPAQGPAPMNMAHGGMVERIAEAGRSGDNQLAFLSPTARQMLRDTGGSGTTNPITGLPEYAWFTPILEQAGKLGARMFEKPQVVAGYGPNAVGGSMGGRLVEGAQNIASKIPTPSFSGVTARLPQVVRNNPITSTAAGALGTGVGASYLRSDDNPIEPGGVRKVDPAAAAAAAAKRDADAADAAANFERGPADFDDAGISPEVLAGILKTPDSTSAAVATSPAAPVPAAPKKTLGTETNDLLSKITARQGLLNQVIPGDTEGRQAQALFLLSDALAKMAYTGGRTPVEGIVKSFANVPAGLAQLGSQESARKQRINMAAAEQIFGEEAEGRKYENQLKIANARAGASAALRDKPINDIVDVLVASGQDPGQALILAKGIKSGVITMDRDPSGTPRITNPFGNTVTAKSELNPNEIGYIYPDAPNVIKARAMSPATPNEQPKLYEKKRELQSYSNQLDDMVGGDFFKVFGPAANMQRAIGTNILMPIFGPNAPWAKLDEQGKRNALELFKKQFERASASGGGRIAVAEQNELSSLLEDPKALLGSPELAFDVLNRLRINTTNQIAEINNSLDPVNYPPLRINPNANYGISPRSALNINDPNSLRLMDQYAKVAPGFQPYIMAGAQGKPERVEDLQKFLSQPDIQRVLGRGQ